MDQLNFPQYQFKIILGSKGTQIFDIVRQKFVVLTPEEWVRQHAILFLHKEKSFPIGLMGVEKEIRVNNMKKRFDLVCFNSEGKPFLICEFKQPNVPISPEVFKQVSNYNHVLKAPYVYVSNGLDHYVAKINFEAKSFSFLNEIPNHHN